jgi:hypothetical protein
MFPEGAANLLRLIVDENGYQALSGQVAYLIKHLCWEHAVISLHRKSLA